MNQTFIFEEFEENNLSYIFEYTRGTRMKHPVFPIEGPAFLKMLLSKR